MTIFFFLVAYACGAFLGSLWIIRCNSVTAREVGLLIDAIVAENMRRIDRGNFASLWDEHGSVAVRYRQHMWRRVTLRDPWTIYPPELRALLRKEK